MSKNVWNQKNQWARARVKKTDQKRRRRKRLRSHLLQIIFGSALVLALFLVLSFTVFFHLEEVDIQGASGFTKQDFENQTGVLVGDNLFRINTGAVEKQLLQQNVRFDDVTVKRKFPDTLLVEVEAAQTACACYWKGSYYYTSLSGRLLSVSTDYDPASNVPLVGGVDLSNYNVGDFIADSKEYHAPLQFFQLAKKVGLSDIREVQISGTGEITFNYQNKMTILMGSSKELEYKFQIVEKVISDYLEGQEGILDARTIATAYFRPMTMEVQQQSGKAVSVVTADSSLSATGDAQGDEPGDSAQDLPEDGSLPEGEPSAEDGWVAVPTE